MKTFEELAKHIIKLPSKHRQKIVAIDGGGGAGKSTFAKSLSLQIPGSEIIHIDDFYIGPWDKRLDHREYDINPNFDWDRFEAEVITPLKQGNATTYHVYDWHKHNTEKVVSVPSDAVIILEGGSTLQPRFADVYDYKIWVEAPEGERLQKALVRDGEHMRFMWEEDWLPVERNYIRVHNPASHADLVIPGHKYWGQTRQKGEE